MAGGFCGLCPGLERRKRCARHHSTRGASERENFHFSGLSWQSGDMRAALVGLLSALVVGGCSTTPITEETGEPVPAERVYQPELAVSSSERTARISFLRDAGMAGAACIVVVRVDDQKAFALGSGEYHALYLVPGRHSFGVEFGTSGLCPASFSARSDAVLADGADESYRVLLSGSGENPGIALVSATAGGSGGSPERSGSAGSPASTPTVSGPSGDVVHRVCLEAEARELQAKGADEDRATSAHLLCQVVSGDCRENAGGPTCTSALRRLDASSRSSGSSMLFAAAHAGDLEIAKAMIALGSDPNEAPAKGWTPLMIAAAEGHESVVFALLDAGADPNARNDLGRTALMFAASKGFTPIVTALLARNASPDLAPADGQGWTALMVASSNGHLDSVKALLEAGATPASRDEAGETALSLARQRGHRDVAELLEEKARGGSVPR
jgi:uncharacterized protein